MADLGEMKVKISADITELVKGLDSAGGSTERFADVAAKSTKLVGNSFDKLDSIFDNLRDNLHHDIDVKVFDALNVSVRKTSGTLEGLGKDALQASGYFVRLPRVLNTTSAALAKTTIEASRLDSTLDRKLKVGTNSAGFALQNLGRVAQDLPFGFIGIQNNLNPLLESFQRLKAETGSSKAALQALGGSLIGPGGLGLALSLVSSAIVIYQNGIAGFNKKTKEAKEATDDFKKAVESIFHEAAQEATNVQSLIVVLNSETETRKRKLEALNDLKRIQPEIFNGLKLEGTAVVGLDAAYQQYIANLKTVIAVKIKQQQLEKVTEQILQKEGVTITRQERLLKQGSDNLKKRLKDNLFVQTLNEKDKKAQEEKNELYKDQKSLLDDIDQLSKGIKTTPLKEIKTGKTKGEIEYISDVLAKLDRQIAVISQEELIFRTDKTKEKIAAVESSINHLVDKFKLTASDPVIINLEGRIQLFKLDQWTKDILKGKDIKPFQVPFEILFENSPTNEATIERAKKSLQDQIGKGFGNQDEGLQIGLSNLLNENDFDDQKQRAFLIGMGINKAFVDGLKTVPLKNEFDRISSELDNFNNGIFEIQKNLQSELAGGLGDALATAFSGGDFGKDLFSGIFQSLGGALQQLGKIAIETGIGIKAIKKAFQSLNPVVAIAAGVGLIALGGLIKNSVAKIPGFAGGVQNFGGGLALVGERGPELVNLPKGSDVIPNHELNGLGLGGQNIHVTVGGTLRARGSELLYVIDNATASRGRST